MANAEDVFRFFNIDLDAGTDPVFHGGELITGNLKIELKQPLTIQAIRLQFKGRAAFITNDSSKGAEIEKVYFDKDFTLLDRPPGRPESGHFPWIANFLYSLPFECPLPLGCPTSYENPHAFIRYFIRATVLEETSSHMKEYVAKKAIMVVSPVEHVREASPHPVAASETVSFGGCCCRGKLNAEVQLLKSVYVPGEYVIGSVTIDNRHPKHIVDQIDTLLIDRVTCVASKKSVSSASRTLVTQSLDKTDAIKSKTLLHKDEVILLQIPAVAPSFGASKTPSVSMTANQDAPTNVFSAKIPELPSTATLRSRKQPFLRVDYAIQLSLGRHLLLELPITIAPLPNLDPQINQYHPFIAGAQAIPESDEHGKFVCGDGFTYTPVYPMLAVSDNLRSIASAVQHDSEATSDQK